MRELTRALVSFGKAYAITIVVLGILAFAASRFVATDAVALYQLILALVGMGYFFASVLSWTGFGNLYRYSPTLLIGSPSYRRMMAEGTIAKEGRDRGSLGIGVFFGLALLGSGLALSGWIFAAAVVAVAIAVVAILRSFESSTAKST